MPTKRAKSREDGADRFIDSVADAERSALDAVRRFLETVNKAFPDVGPDGGQRQRIIDSAFRMTEELVGTSNQFAHRLVEASADAARSVPVKRAGARRPAARKAPAKKATARKAPAKKATARKAPAKKAAAG